MELSSLTISNRRLILKTGYLSKEIAKSVAGYKWNGETKTWEYPLDPVVALDLQAAFSRCFIQLDIHPAIRSLMAAHKARVEEMARAKSKLNINLRTSLAKTLYPFQALGVGFMLQAGNCLLADDMGLGKTIQALALADEIGAQNICIICPNSLKQTWVDEIVKWLGPQNNITFNKAGRWKFVDLDTNYERSFTIVNYEAVRLKDIQLVLQCQPADLLIIDEAHRIKNRKAKQTVAIKQLPAARTLLLTGTPILNRPDELWSLLNRLYPKRYSSYWRFYEQYVDYNDGYFGREYKGSKNEDRLAREIAPLFLRREKSEVLTELPPKTYEVHYTEMLPEQSKLYKQMQDDMIAQFSAVERVDALVAIAQLTRLKQLTIHPALIVPSWDGKSGKFETAVELIKDVTSSGKKVVVFSQYEKLVRLLCARLEKEGIKTAEFTGKIPTDQRQAAVERFKSSKEPIAFVATIQAGGLGLTLTEADICIFIDRLWTPAYNQQAEDRLHRIGQTGNVTIINLLVPSTVEENIEKMLQDKTVTIDSILRTRTIQEILENQPNSSSDTEK